VSLRPYIVRLFLAAPSDAVLFVQLRCSCSDSASSIIDTFVFPPGEHHFDAAAPSACACVAVVAPATFIANPQVTHSCFSPPPALPLNVTWWSSCMVFEPAGAPCFPFVGPPHVASATAVINGGRAEVSLILQSQGAEFLSAAQVPAKLSAADAMLYDSVFSRACESCSS
jgi:hypothetical protein